ncbi:TonB-dependent receptor domain-containing protein [Hydrogenophaga sp.]|uniref:TonB-dependent receptor domain-containing protein n=1 Tax=Hydrogenophaga sp. TaxID=1904254 RepID=UPI002735930C|nr:TonB-dependent receptor [Hydrogenophaga sp.]MDP3325068.1 TonB-dependent receptor [Hydrogenophaga sp.]MDP3883437.1 TonB-dependent receptor [Hydrogenophaga sp.]MDZ4177459.1 TonB-dependent receptor [Hydrogenophaga sp.]
MKFPFMKTCFYSVPVRAFVSFRASALSIAVAAAFPSFAQTQLKEIVVTATRSESRADAVISDVSVITREDIERGTGRTLPELIARVSGLQMWANGGLGKNSSLSIRGSENRQVLLLVDGVRYGSATAGAANFDNIPLESIERIEVLKGPASALYGSDAVGGVIQVFTRKGTPGLHPYASVTVGGDDRHEVAAGLSGGSADVTYSIGLQTMREKGFSATNPQVAFGGFNADADGFSQDTVNAALDWKLAPGWKVDARVLQADSVSQFDNGPGAFDARTDTVSSVYALGVEGQLVSNWKTRLAFGTSEDRSTSWTSATPSEFNTEQDQWTWLNEIGTPIGKVMLGYERVIQKVSGTQAYAVNQRTTDSWLAGLNGAAGRHSWQLNARRDQESQFGNVSTGLAGYGFKFNPNWRAFGSYGTSFKAPSFNTLYFVSPFFVGNPTTQPERGRNSELGMAYSAGAHEVRLTYFVNRIKGFITTAPVVANIPYARIEGWTLAYEGQIDAFTYRAALDLLDARNEANNLKLPRRADQQLTAGFDYALGRWKLGASLLAASERFDNATNTQPLAGYATVDIHADYAVSKDWSLEGRVNNVGDKAYMTAYGYNQAGRGAYITLRYQPK